MATKQVEWTPASTNPTKQQAKYFVTLATGVVTSALWSNDNFLSANLDCWRWKDLPFLSDKVIAWAPFYKKEEIDWIPAAEKPGKKVSNYVVLLEQGIVKLSSWNNTTPMGDFDDAWHWDCSGRVKAWAFTPDPYIEVKR